VAIWWVIEPERLASIGRRSRLAVDEESLQWPEQAARAAREAGNSHESVAEGLASEPTFQLLLADRPPQLIDYLRARSKATNAVAGSRGRCIRRASGPGWRVCSAACSCSQEGSD